MIHVVPREDIKEHELTTTCDCDPTLDYEYVDIIVVHNAFDERHNIERLYEEIGFDLPDDHIGWAVIKTEES